MRPPFSDRSSTAADEGRELAVAVLGFIAADETRLERFLALTGLGPHNLRKAAAEPGFLGSVLGYLATDDRLLVRFAAETGRRPEDLALALEALRGPPAADP
jgi:hypothetical protein